jgi:hypothetical protein
VTESTFHCFCGQEHPLSSLGRPVNHRAPAPAAAAPDLVARLRAWADDGAIPGLAFPDILGAASLIASQATELESLRDVKPGVLVVPAEAVDQVVLIENEDCLEDLPPYSVVLDADLDVYQLQHDTRNLLRWYMAGAELPTDPGYMTYPVTLIHRGDPS